MEWFKKNKLKIIAIGLCVIITISSAIIKELVKEIKKQTGEKNKIWEINKRLIENSKNERKILEKIRNDLNEKIKNIKEKEKEIKIRLDKKKELWKNIGKILKEHKKLMESKTLASRELGKIFVNKVLEPIKDKSTNDYYTKRGEYAKNKKNMEAMNILCQMLAIITIGIATKNLEGTAEIINAEMDMIDLFLNENSSINHLCDEASAPKEYGIKNINLNFLSAEKMTKRIEKFQKAEDENLLTLKEGSLI